MGNDANIKVSVIIPVYNKEKYLPNCLDCMLNQTINDLELICIDDGSTDKSLDNM
ncbi:MAG: glycosyltransferase [Deferribacteraceae bacterium]|nr:glycosyltransferase [Deferribacteraceae bacterium]